MNYRELKDQLRMKTLEFEMAMEAGRPHTELMKFYRELKELQYEILQLEIADRSKEDLYLV